MVDLSEPQYSPLGKDGVLLDSSIGLWLGNHLGGFEIALLLVHTVTSDILAVPSPSNPSVFCCRKHVLLTFIYSAYN